MKRAGLATLLLAGAVIQGCAADSRSTSAVPSEITTSMSLPATSAPDVSSPVAESVPLPTAVVTTPLPEPPVGDRALGITADLVGGGQFDGADYGDRPVVLWFWGPV